MEEVEDHNNINIPTRKISVNAAEIIKKFKSIKDRQMFCREMSKYYFIMYRSLFSKRTWI